MENIHKVLHCAGGGICTPEALRRQFYRLVRLTTPPLQLNYIILSFYVKIVKRWQKKDQDNQLFWFVQFVKAKIILPKNQKRILQENWF